MLKGFKTSAEEANFIVDEIKRVIAQSGGFFDYGDFAILSRCFVNSCEGDVYSYLFYSAR